MKRFKIVMSAFALVFMAFSANAQSCCSKKSDKAACCAKPGAAETKTASATDAETTAILVANEAGIESKTFKVYGNCGMCKTRIEGALKEVKGIQVADWNADTKMMTVNYDASIINVEDIQKKIAAIGHDAGEYRAEDSVYNQLHGCCQYERAKI
ncbi:MAG: hypothetical protein DHS20C18_18670 [Saprospiraceae bacterium]|nr:MAG: hypothetical protein DHS20C18_18670 [Saprospiraceae bacterium]